MPRALVSKPSMAHRSFVPAWNRLIVWGEHRRIHLGLVPDACHVGYCLKYNMRKLKVENFNRLYFFFIVVNLQNTSTQQKVKQTS